MPSVTRHRSKRWWGYFVWVGAALVVGVPEITAAVSHGDGARCRRRLGRRRMVGRPAPAPRLLRDLHPAGGALVRRPEPDRGLPGRGRAVPDHGPDRPRPRGLARQADLGLGARPEAG